MIKFYINNKYSFLGGGFSFEKFRFIAYFQLLKKELCVVINFHFLIFILGILLLMLGSHGFYAYFHRLDTVFSLISGESNKLFFEVDLPLIDNQIKWMTEKGIQSWLIPLLSVITGIILILPGVRKLTR